MKTGKRDIIIISIIVLLAAVGFIIFNSVAKSPSKDPAVIQHWYVGDNGFNITEDLVLIDFDNKKVNRLKQQSNVPSDYGSFPIIDEQNSTVTMLGEYVNPQSSKREVLVVKYDFEKRSVQIIEETSPKGICSNFGESVKIALICIPNQLKVIFQNSGSGIIDNEQ